MAILGKTLMDVGFDGIFSEVSHDEKLGLINPHHLRLFQLSVVDNAFTFDVLKRFLLINIGQYIYSRERIKKFMDENEITLIGLKAVELLRSRCNGDLRWLGDELGDLMLYVFLEQILDAPKVFSKFDLPADGHLVPGSSGVHLLQPDNVVPTYQMVFGKSRIVGDPRDAIDAAFVTLEAIKNDTSREMRLVESTAFDKQFTPEVAELLQSLILPSKGQSPTHDTAFGVFLGYSLGLDVDGYTSEQFRAELERKMKLDIKNHVTYIVDKIKAAKMERYSFYFYFLPFNKADGEKQSIMGSLLGLKGGCRMTDEFGISLGDVIFADIDRNPYLIDLYNHILYNYTLSLFGITQMMPKEVDVEAALRFADVLSKSTDKEKSDRHKIWAQEIVALLKETQPDNPAVLEYFGSVLLSTENFRGLAMNAPQFQGRTLLDRFYTEFCRELLSIPADKEKQFFRSQKEVYDRLTEPYFSYSGPTSMGKSFVMRMFIKKQVMDGSNLNFAILVPTKALINEVYSKIIEDLKIDEKRGYLAEHNYTLVTAAGALQLKKGDMNFIFVLTPERLLYLLIGKPDVRIDYLFIDEAHKISAKDSRSAFYYKVVDMISQKQKPHVIFASPNIPNPEVYLKLLPDADMETDRKLATSFSPVSQIKILVDLICGEIKTFNSYTGQLDTVTSFPRGENLHQIIASVCRRREDRKMQNIVYFNSKEKAVEYALDFAKNVPEQSDDALTSLAKEVRNEVHGDYYLADIITNGVAYHIGYLPASIRVRIEGLYRDRKIHTLFCTSTLLEGVNLPADNLFITTYGKGRGRSKMKAVDFKNLIGRVGRIEYNLYGNVFLVRLESKTTTEGFIELLKQEVPEQELSLVSELTSSQKKQIVACLLEGDIGLDNVKLKTKESYKLIRKFAMILLRDIMKGNNSVVRREFAQYLQGDTEEKIKTAFKKKESEPDDDINISVDQTKSLYGAIANGLEYPALTAERNADYDTLMPFLQKLSRIFNWGKYDSETIGNNNRLTWYGVILARWINGHGLNFIMTESIDYYRRHPDKTVSVNNKPEVYNGSKRHKNSVIGETLEAIERVILFSLSNYFLKFSEAYKKYYHIDGDMKNDWYEYVEYGTTNPLTILLQRNGFSRETAMYIRKHRTDYVDGLDTAEPRLKRSLAQCGNYSVELEVADMLYNNPELFVN